MSAPDSHPDTRRARRLRPGEATERSAPVTHTPPDPALADAAAALRFRTRSAQGLPATVTDPTAVSRVVEVMRPRTTTELGRRARQAVTP